MNLPLLNVNALYGCVITSTTSRTEPDGTWVLGHDSLLVNADGVIERRHYDNVRVRYE